VTVIDAATAQVVTTIQASGTGLCSIATANGLAYAVNIVTQELVVVDPATDDVNRFSLSDEPVAIAASEGSGAVYVLSALADAVIGLDPTDGSELGRVLIVGGSAPVAMSPTDMVAVRPQLAISQSDETIYATVPQVGGLAVVRNEQFPVSAYHIAMPTVVEEATES
jgi:outer membrane protein assembly factor BamB